MTPAEQALAVLRVSEGNILSQWHCAGREVFEPFGPWLATVREAIARFEPGDKVTAKPLDLSPEYTEHRANH